MTIELIPVIEILYKIEGVKAPEEYPYWENSKIWDAYFEKCNLLAGFKDRMKPYLKGSSFYRLTEITDANLTKLIIDHTQKIRDEINSEQHASTFFGGYVLQVDGKDKYFPQCCSGLSDIIYWSRISSGESSYCEGHPAPQIKFEDNNILIDFSIDDLEEQFEPTPSETFLSINRHELKKAIEKVKIELQNFELRLIKINYEEKLNIDSIGKLLIWENPNYD